MTRALQLLLVSTSLLVLGCARYHGAPIDPTPAPIPSPIVVPTPTPAAPVAITLLAHESLLEQLRPWLGSSGAVTLTLPGGRKYSTPEAVLEIPDGCGATWSIEDGAYKFAFANATRPRIEFVGLTLDRVDAIILRRDNTGEVKTGWLTKSFRFDDGKIKVGDADTPKPPRDVPVDRRPVVYMYSPPWCGACKEAKRKLLERAEPLPFRVIVRETETDLAKSYPCFHWEVSAGKGKVLNGFPGVDELIKAWSDSRADKSPTANCPDGKCPGGKCPAGRASLTYPSPIPSEWTWPGDLREHLAGMHRANVAALSDAECVRLHDHLHGGAW